MQVIIISSNSHGHKHWHLSKAKILSLVLLFILAMGLSSFALAKWLQSDSTVVIPHISQHQSLETSESSNIYTTKLFDDETAQNFYAKQLGGLQAETIRLKMLSQQLAEKAGIDISAFMIEEVPAQGGVEHQGLSLSVEQLDAGIEGISQALQNQQYALATLEQFILTKETITSAIPQGRPIDSGWISSYYGYRIDPFNGRKTFHEGLDFAGKEGSPVSAVAEGIVSWVGKRSGYGGLVEVDHGNGYITRYAHNKTITVKKGEHVTKGQQLALMGSTGRSTGPHVHFEVLRDGKHINPYDYVK